MQTILGSFLFLVLLRTGTSLECEVCNGMGNSCTGSMMTCEPGLDTCAIILTENSLAGERIQTVMKQCYYSNACNSLTTDMNLGQGRYVRTIVSCCEGDACRTTSPQISSAMQPNGKQCPACYSLSASGCDIVTADCDGEENYCLDMVQKVTYGKFVVNVSMKGCVTENVCAAKEGQTSSSGIDTNIMKVSCTPAPVAA
uniref:Ly6/PLAUR domain-containing protein 8 n=1 Tax=Pogona vitticeps TaxID=103695 RepID=A0ABM5ES22_9SAUR